MSTAIVLFNRDLRVRDNPALAAAAMAEQTVPLFVLDEKLIGSRFAAPNRVAFMLEALRDLDGSLRRAGGRLYVRRGDPVREAIAVARECDATELHVSADWSAYARRREGRLRDTCEEERIAFHAHGGTTIVAPGAVTPAGSDHFKVFTPFQRAWEGAPLRPRAGAPRRLSVPSRLAVGRLPAQRSLLNGPLSPRRAAGGESEGRRLMGAFLRDRLAGYEAGHDDLPGDVTSSLSPTCASAASRRWSCSARPGPSRGAPPTPASSAGATSTTRCSPPSPPFPGATTGHAEIAGRARGAPSRHGARAAPATRSSTRRCASCSTRAACTTGRG